MTEIQITPKYRDVKPSGSYVYLHIRESDGVCFHVGKGSGRRGWDRFSRSSWWESVASKHGCRVVVFRDGMSESCAFSLEKILIHLYTSIGVKLTNMTNGGEGVSGVVMPSRKPVVNSNGERFASITEAAMAYKERGEYKASTGDISGAASGKRLTACGCAWWYEGDEPKTYTNRRRIQGLTVGKAVVSSKGERFLTMLDAEKYLKVNGYPKAKSYNISRCARGEMDYVYGRGWIFIDKSQL